MRVSFHFILFSSSSQNHTKWKWTLVHSYSLLSLLVSRKKHVNISIHNTTPFSVSVFLNHFGELVMGLSVCELVLPFLGFMVAFLQMQLPLVMAGLTCLFLFQFSAHFFLVLKSKDPILFWVLCAFVFFFPLICNRFNGWFHWFGRLVWD